MYELSSCLDSLHGIGQDPLDVGDEERDEEEEENEPKMPGGLLAIGLQECHRCGEFRMVCEDCDGWRDNCPDCCTIHAM